LLDDETRDGWIVVYGIRIRHRADAGPTTGDSGRSASRNCLFVLLTRLAQMCVQVDEARRDDQTSSVDHVRLFGNGLAAIEQADDAAVFDQQAAPTGVNLLRGVDYITICNQQLHYWVTLRSRFCLLTGAVSSSAST